MDRVITKTWLSQKPSSQAWFVAIWSLFFLVVSSAFYWQNIWNAGDWMPASKAAIFQQGQWWRLWTALWAHSDLGHLASNSMLFAVFAYLLSGYFGLWVFPWLGLFMGGIANAIVVWTYAPEMNLLGMSGVVYWMGGCWLALYFLLDIQRSPLQRFLRAGGVALAVFMPSSAFDPHISYQAHLVGFILGALCGVLIYFLRRQEFRDAIEYEEIYEDTVEDLDSKTFAGQA